MKPTEETLGYWWVKQNYCRMDTKEKRDGGVEVVLVCLGRRPKSRKPDMIPLIVAKHWSMPLVMAPDFWQWSGPIPFPNFPSIQSTEPPTP